VCALPTAAFFRVFTPVCMCVCVYVCLSVLRVSPCVSVFEEARIYTYIKGGRPEEACNQPNCKVMVVFLFSSFSLFTFGVVISGRPNKTKEKKYIERERLPHYKS
jgi:hypothetical protein